MIIDLMIQEMPYQGCYLRGKFALARVRVVNGPAAHLCQYKIEYPPPPPGAVDKNDNG